MFKLIRIPAIALVAANLFAAPALAQPNIFKQTVSLNGVDATVQVVQSTVNDFQIQFRFHSEVTGVGCLSAYQDMRYQLLDGTGRLISVNQSALQNHPSEEYGTVNHVISSNRNRLVNCNSVGQDRLVRAFISALYPQLAAGTYRLQIAFAPRGTRGVDFAAVYIAINPSPSESPMSDARAAPENLVELRLDASKPVVREGQGIQVRVIAVNHSSETIGVAQITPWEAVRLHVLSNGREIIPSRIGSGIRNRGGNLVPGVMNPGQTWVFRTFVDPSPYYPISAWGFWQVPPGRHTIFATPAAAPMRVNKRWTGLKTWSNGIMVTVEP